MSKKQKRQVSQPAVTIAATPKSGATTLRPSFSSEFNPDYTHIKRDLRRIGVLAVSFVGILVVLSFFLK